MQIRRLIFMGVIMKHIKIALCICAVVVVALMPFTAFGAVTEYNSGVRWADIIEDNNINLQNAHVIWRASDGYYYIGTFRQGFSSPTSTTNAANIGDASQISLIFNTTGSFWTIYKSRQPYNPYGTYSTITWGYGDGNDTYTGSLAALCANSIDITYGGETVFQPAPLGVSTTGNQGATSPTQTATSASLSSQIHTTTLQGVLIEVISILPILVPVLITFIAIRKGLAFILATLRAS